MTKDTGPKAAQRPKVDIRTEIYEVEIPNVGRVVAVGGPVPQQYGGVLEGGEKEETCFSITRSEFGDIVIDMGKGNKSIFHNQPMMLRERRVKVGVE